MEISGWDQRYKAEIYDRNCADAPTPLVAETASGLRSGSALDLACGTGRNALWLAKHGWAVTAVDGSPTAIEILKNRAATSGLKVDARVADLERGEYAIEAGKWDLIVIAFYLQRDLFDPAVKGLKPGGILIAIVHITDNEEEATKHRLLPGELPTFFTHQEIVSLKEGKPTDPAHKRSAAEIVVRRPQTRSTTQ